MLTTNLVSRLVHRKNTEMANVRINGRSRNSALRYVLIIFAVGIAAAAALLIFVFVSEAPIVPDLDDLEPLPEEMQVIDSFTDVGHGGGRVPAEVNLVIEAEGSTRDGVEEALTELRTHLRNKGWREAEGSDWGFTSVRPNGPILRYGTLDAYLQNITEGTLVNNDLLAFLRDHQGRGRLLLVAIG